MNFFKRSIVIFTIFLFFSANGVLSWFDSNEILQENNQKRINTLEESIKQITAEEMSQIRGEISSISETLTLALSGIKTSIQEKSKSYNESQKFLVYAIVSTWVISIIFVLKKCFNCINCSQDFRRIDVPSYQFQLPYHDNRGKRLYINRETSFYDNI
uniref:SVM_signal domain-containing protein n=1 Tax=Strongyloides venezuelensis TaxID=75913 RepID=A0A0K0FT73_STRVS